MRSRATFTGHAFRRENLDVRSHGRRDNGVTKSVSNAGVIEEGRRIDRERRVEAPAERPIENSSGGYERIDTKPGIPIPSEAAPARAKYPGSRPHVGARGTDA